MEDGRQRLFCFAMQSRIGVPVRPVAWGGQGGGKKLATDVAGRRARRSRSSVRPNPFEDAVGVADREIRGTTTMAIGLRARDGEEAAIRSVFLALPLNDKTFSDFPQA